MASIMVAESESERDIVTDTTATATATDTTVEAPAPKAARKATNKATKKAGRKATKSTGPKRSELLERLSQVANLGPKKAAVVADRILRTKGQGKVSIGDLVAIRGVSETIAQDVIEVLETGSAPARPKIRKASATRKPAQRNGLVDVEVAAAKVAYLGEGIVRFADTPERIMELGLDLIGQAREHLASR